MATQSGRRHTGNADCFCVERVIAFFVIAELQGDGSCRLARIHEVHITALTFCQINKTRSKEFAVGKHVNQVIARVAQVGHIHADVQRTTGMVMPCDIDVIHTIRGRLTVTVAGDRAGVTMDGNLDVIDVTSDALLPIFSIGHAVNGNDAVGARGESPAKVERARGISVVPAGEVTLLAFIHD